MGVGALAGSGAVAQHMLTDTVSASADISAGNFSLADTDHTLVDGTIADVPIEVTATYSWDANVDVTAYELALSVGTSPSTASVIATHEQDDMGMASYEDTQTLQGSVLNSGAFDAEMFVPPDNSTREITIWAAVELLVFRNGNMLATAKVTDTGTVTVTEESIQLTGSLSASGSVDINEE
jgi:hypothetical protein